MVTRQLLDSSSTFRLRQPANKTHALVIIGEHWIDHLEAEGHLGHCQPDEFRFESGWLPLYTRAGITMHVSGLISLLKTQGDCPLIAVVRADMSFHSDQEYMIQQLHKEECLSRVTLYYGESRLHSARTAG